VGLDLDTNGNDLGFRGTIRGKVSTNLREMIDTSQSGSSDLVPFLNLLLAMYSNGALHVTLGSMGEFLQSDLFLKEIGQNSPELRNIITKILTCQEDPFRDFLAMASAEIKPVGSTTDKHAYAILRTYATFVRYLGKPETLHVVVGDHVVEVTFTSIHGFEKLSQITEEELAKLNEIPSDFLGNNSSSSSTTTTESGIPDQWDHPEHTLSEAATRKDIPDTILLKLLLAGPASVGKSQILSRYSEDNFTETYLTTIGIDFRVKTEVVSGKTIKFQIWDSAGQERFRSISQSYYRSAAGMFLVYDITSANSYEDIKRTFYEDAIRNNPQQLVLVGNKLDLEEAREVQRSTAEEWATSNNLFFVEVSAKTGENVNMLFEEVGKRLLEKMFGV